MDHLLGKQNIHLLDVDMGVLIAPFVRVLNVFGDGTFWALSTPGHTRDHLAYLINTFPTPKLIVGDAELTRWGMENGVFMNSDYRRKGLMDAQHSAKMIREFHAMYPFVPIWFSHDEQSQTRP
jgi:glyoxylase-like metal-dependent hydrolase (beta-lactamase superfamily II)